MIKLKEVAKDLATVDCKKCGKTISVFKAPSHFKKEHNIKLTKNEKKYLAKRMFKLSTLPFAFLISLFVLLFGVLAEAFYALCEVVLTLLDFWQ
jgi:hypothetical protein